jgi:hypothetical protein
LTDSTFVEGRPTSTWTLIVVGILFCWLSMDNRWDMKCLSCYGKRRWSGHHRQPSQVKMAVENYVFVAGYHPCISDCGHGELWFHIPHNASQL